MGKLFPVRILKNAELLLRLTMIVATITAGVSKFFSHGGFHDYYLQQFNRPELRIQLPSFLPDFYLTIIPFIEVGLGLALFIPRTRRIFAVVFVLYFLTLSVGHYIMEEFLEVDVVLPLTLIGILDYILPSYTSYFKRMAEDE
ncbi:MAG: DoxX family membrane protein [Chitinophagaceae bacterium]|nr:DoxX family membrane protein [Chitinophagaceae bacterium]